MSADHTAGIASAPQVVESGGHVGAPSTVTAGNAGLYSAVDPVTQAA